MKRKPKNYWTFEKITEEDKVKRKSQYKICKKNKKRR